MIDGKHTGTGGGNHVVVGGATTLDSPFLRRPDLLRSLILHWQRHPSISYLFSGLFIGPTSPGAAHRRGPPRRALRARDRARADAAARRRATPPPPWLVDRLLRNLLVDVTGNTHRAEICIDKLYSPDGPTGRLGLVEFRGFEMPPDPRMSLAQQLLIRALIARLWHEPGHRRAHPLGHGAARPLHAAALRLGGLPRRAARPRASTASTCAPTGSRRRPSSASRSAARSRPTASTSSSARRSSPGTCSARPAPSAAPCATPTARSSGCRSSSTTTDPDRYVVACNQRRVPLQPTGTGGVAGRRRALQGLAAGAGAAPGDPGARAARPSTSSTPGPAARIGGCTYHVAHPGGRSYDTFPVNGNEAEARRLARFEPHGHTPGGYMPPVETPHREFPMTLDLRRAPGI